MSILQAAYNELVLTNSRLRAENERLRANGQRFIKWVDDLYSDLPNDKPPGPPRQMLIEMRAAFGHQQQGDRK